MNYLELSPADNIMPLLDLVFQSSYDVDSRNYELEVEREERKVSGCCRYVPVLKEIVTPIEHNESD